MAATDRVRRIFDALTEPVDRIVVRTGTEPFLDPAFFYVTGLTGGLFEHSSAICHPSGDVEVLCPPLEESIAVDAGLDVTAYEKRSAHDDLLADRLADATTVGFHGDGLTVELYEAMAGPLDADLIDVSDAIAEARLVKDEGELDRIREACDVATTVLGELPDLLEVGAEEASVAADIEHRMRRLGASGPAFDTIVAFGEGSAKPHYTTGGETLSEGDLALIDFGAVVDRYRSDVTRTFVAGEPTKRQAAMYETVLDAQQAALDRIEPGASMGSIHAAAEDVIEGSEFAGRFIHSTGHGLGLATHDGGALAEDRDDPLKPGMVFTVEPGVYLPDEGGVRIEDDIVVTDDGCEVLTGGLKGLDSFSLAV